MKYWQPFGISDPQAPYINGDPTIGRAGSIPPAGAFEQPQRELVNLIKYSGINPDDTTVEQLFQAVRSQRINYAAADTASNENQLAVSFVPPIGNNRTNGMPLRIKAARTNTGPCQLTVDGVTAPLRRADTAELIANDLRAATIFECIWNDTFWAMTNYRGIGGGSGGGTTNTFITKIPYAIDTSTSANTIIAAFADPITALVPGDTIEVKLKNTITGPSVIRVNALPAIAVVRGDGNPLRPNDAVVNQIMLLMYSDANNFQFTGIVPSAFSGLPMPVGSLVLSLGATAFAGTLKANGTVLVRAEHPQLWNYANNSFRIVDEFAWQNGPSRTWTSFSRGDGSTNFRLPDLRGEFMRFFDDAKGVDPSRLLTSQQADLVGAFSFSGSATLIDPVGFNGGNVQGAGGHLGKSTCISYIQWSGEQNMFTSSTSFAAFGGDSGPGWDPLPSITGQLTFSGSGGPETRPRNTAIVPCIVDG